MFRPEVRKTPARSALAFLEVIFHASVRNVRKSHGNAVWGLVMNILQTVLLVAIFYATFYILGMRSSPLRGDYLLYIMSGVFMFMTHTKTMAAVTHAEGPTSAMMKHAPMNPIVSISAAAISSLYTQVLSISVVLYLYHVLFIPITIDDPIGALAMLILSWASGVAIGMIFLSAKPWNPTVIGLIATVYMRANMITSGKMFVANNVPTHTLKMFSWNPLFHTIDQARGFVFLNYNPHYSSIDYAVKITLACLMIGLMGEFYTRKHASLSWSAGV
jgi:ABC-type polysaccharide/polyol phosphate export permease